MATQIGSCGTDILVPEGQEDRLTGTELTFEGTGSITQLALVSQITNAKIKVPGGTNFGVSGATMLKNGDYSYWERPAFKQATDFNPHVVVIKLGTNDTKPQNWKYSEEYVLDYEAMIDHFSSLPAKPKIWLCSPAPVYQTRWGISEEIVVGGVIPKVRDLATRKGLPIIDIYSVLSNKPEMFPDKIHPNASGAKEMADAVMSAILIK